MSSGAQRALAEAMSWLTAALLVIAGVFYQGEIRSAVGLRLGYGQTVTAQPSVTSDSRTASPGRGAQPAAPAPAPIPSGSVRVRADSSGHFNATAYVNGDAIDVLVDTGATTVALTWEDARAAGLHIRESDFTLRSQTANGVALFAPVTLASVRIGDITVYDVRAAVARRGQLHRTLLGMSFLGKVKVEMRDRELLLSR